MDDGARTDVGAPGLERLVIAGLAAACGSIVLLHLWAVCGMGPDAVTATASALPLAVAALVVGVGSLAITALAPRQGAGRGLAAAALGAGAWGALSLWRPGLWAQAAPLPLLGWAAGQGLPALAARLPCSLDGARKRRPAVAALWALLALVTAAQTVRFSAFMADDRLEKGSVVPFVPRTIHHMCLAAYVYAADLVRQERPGVYDPRTYRDFSRVGAPAPAVVGLDRYIEDPFLYPPPFLLFPRLALALSNDYRVLRTGYFALQALGFVAAAVALAGWLGKPEGLTTGLLTPALLVSLPIMFNLQYGQAQLI